jgi:hypothetical protein
MRIYLVICLVVLMAFFTAACGSSAEEVAQAVAATNGDGRPVVDFAQGKAVT